MTQAPLPSGAGQPDPLLLELSRKNAELEELTSRLEALSRRMSEELRLAARVQRSLLPAPLSHPRLDLALEFLPFRELGGDYVDLISLGDDRLAFAIGDVMGKGVSAALLAANLQACLRSSLQAGIVEPVPLVERVNRLFGEVSPKSLFASLFFGVFDFARGRLEYTNAGHDYPFKMCALGTTRELVEGGPVLGLLESARYESGSVCFDAHDLFIFYSDGLTDRTDLGGQAFGSPRLIQSASRHRASPSRILLYALLGEVQDWSAGRPPEDDLTLAVARVR